MLYSHKRYDISTYVFIYIYIFMIYILGLTIEHISLTHLIPIYSHLPFLIIMLTYQRIWRAKEPQSFVYHVIILAWRALYTQKHIIKYVCYIYISYIICNLYYEKVILYFCCAINQKFYSFSFISQGKIIYYFFRICPYVQRDRRIAIFKYDLKIVNLHNLLL